MAADGRPPRPGPDRRPRGKSDTVPPAGPSLPVAAVEPSPALSTELFPPLPVSRSDAKQSSSVKSSNAIVSVIVFPGDSRDCQRSEASRN